MEQFEQLLTCAICLDRYRNPKLLPCQHSFCMEPCMDGLVDYVRRQVKCPECRAEHRIPYQGVQGFPTNVTLQRFLELHIEITGELPDPTSGQIMKRCNVCSEKAYCALCNHCDKEVCPDCKGAHMDILRREISRINNQVRRALHRLQDMLALAEKNMLALQTNCASVSEEVDEIYRRLTKALKDRTEYLHGEVDRYLTTEVKNLNTLKENLELEISNIQANCDLADKHMQSENIEWDDCELMDAKEIFLKTVDFIRNFESETNDYTRRVRFVMQHDPNQLVLHVAGYGDLSINMPHQPFTGGTVGGQSTGMLQPPGPGLMRSKSDHRLASQFRQQDERGYDRGGLEGNESGRVSPLGGRKFGERYPRNESSRLEGSRYGRGGDRGGDYGADYDQSYDNEGGRPSARSRLRSRLARHAGNDNDSDNDTQGGRSVRFTEGGHQTKERERVLDTEDVARGPLSGITRLYDSPRVMKRLQESEVKKDKPQPVPPPVVRPVPQTPKRVAVPGAVGRQISEEDEITKIKRLNKNAPGEPVSPPETTRPAAERVTALKRGTGADEEREERQQPSSPASSRSTPSSEHSRKTSAQEAASSDGESDDTSSVGSNRQTQQRRTPSVVSKPQPVTSTPATTGSRRSSASSDVTATGPANWRSKLWTTPGQTVSPTAEETSNSVRSTGAAYTTDMIKKRIMARAATGQPPPTITITPSTTATTTPSSARPYSRTVSTPGNAMSSTASNDRKPFVSRFLGGGNRSAVGAVSTPPTNVDKTTKEEDDDDDDESETTSSSEETDSDEESAEETKSPPKPVANSKSTMEKTDIGPLLARSAQARDSSSGSGTRKGSRDEGYAPRFGNESTYRSPYGSSAASKDESTPSTASSYFNRTRAAAPEPEPETTSSRYGPGGFTSRFLNKSKSSAAVSPEEEEQQKKYPASSAGTTESGYQPGRSRYAALKDRKSRLARSKSSHSFGNEDDDDTEDTANSPSAYLASKYGTSGNDLARSRSTHALKSRENSPERSATTGGTEKDGAALSSWARYLKNKYGNRGKDGKDGASSSSASRRLSLGLPLRQSTVESSDDDQKNLAGSPTSPTQAMAAPAGFAAVGTKSQYLQKRYQQFKVGSRGSEPGSFTWPRGIAVGPDNSIVVADSSNHRVQVFDSNGNFVKEFGSYGNGEGEFDCLAGVAVNRIGQFIIADRYNHRIQVMDPSGRFLRAFGSQGTSDGRFNYPWGITTDALGFIYVCDKENHRVQVFQSDGTFVGKFGSHGNKVGQLEHPHYIAVSNTNRVIVSDSNNHRIQIFDVNGRVLSAFGSEGSENGQFKYPKDPQTHHQTPAATNQNGSCSRRSGIHNSRRLRKQSNSDLPARRNVPTSVRKLGIRGRRVQGSGGSSSNVERQYSGMRQGEPSHSSVLSDRRKLLPPIQLPSVSSLPALPSTSTFTPPSTPPASMLSPSLSSSSSSFIPPTRYNAFDSLQVKLLQLSATVRQPVRLLRSNSDPASLRARRYSLF